MKDLNSLSAFLQDLSKKAQDLTPILYHTQDALYQKTMDSFEKERDPFGNPWAPTKKKKPLKQKILQDTGVLKASIIARNNRVDKVSIGSNLSYAPIHQFGGHAGKGGKAFIPPRAYLPTHKGKIPGDLKRSIKQAIKKHFGF
ncbi:phage virion morphogenesis protein [Helicobacter enhydrae]|uniref:Phage virion morphogenesis protein n=1 Tax=Helicobacter enhydrae TaxID=222136 RepID=A0A1B1U6D0_9HELI|nr:phage virion morphogenesis protein [Helicobacter enhydrae]ANV98300.1 phage virion morphogenesis protein [Helicobacter enhydrae]ANV98570.1 phage virion morphogenesis protein [Helicobacter enhydrae]